MCLVPKCGDSADSASTCCSGSGRSANTTPSTCGPLTFCWCCAAFTPGLTNDGADKMSEYMCKRGVTSTKMRIFVKPVQFQRKYGADAHMNVLLVFLASPCRLLSVRQREVRFIRGRGQQRNGQKRPRVRQAHYPLKALNPLKDSAS